jgi:hypothetical protein
MCIILYKIYSNYAANKKLRKCAWQLFGCSPGLLTNFPVQATGSVSRKQAPGSVRIMDLLDSAVKKPEPDELLPKLERCVQIQLKQTAALIHHKTTCS